MGTKPLIRSATRDDLPALCSVFRRASLANAGDRAWLDDHPEVLTYEFVTGGITRVAELDGRIVGFATVVPPSELEDLFIDPDWMRRGVGRALVQDAIELATAPLEVTANLHALAFYESVGLVAQHAAETPGGPAVRMRLEVADGDKPEN